MQKAVADSGGKRAQGTGPLQFVQCSPGAWHEVSQPITILPLYRGSACNRGLTNAMVYGKVRVQMHFHDPGTRGRKTPFKEVEPGLFVLSRDVPPAAVCPDSPVILWITLPEHHLLTDGIYQEQLMIFDICDLPEEEFDYWKPEFDKAMSKADLVFAASYLLYEKYRYMHHNVHYLPNGANYRAFQRKGPRPADFPETPGPVAGFHGALASWIDWNLVYHLAKRLPRWSFVFVGPLLNITEDRLPYGKNIFYITEKSFEQLPYYTNHFDVGIIPFQVRDMTDYSCPIKMYEYFACGKPVVSTPIHEVSLCPLARIGRSAGEFAGHIEQAYSQVLAETDTSKQFRSWAMMNSWEQRASLADKIIRHSLARAVG